MHLGLFTLHVYKECNFNISIIYLSSFTIDDYKR